MEAAPETPDMIAALQADRRAATIPRRLEGTLRSTKGTPQAQYPDFGYWALRMTQLCVARLNASGEAVNPPVQEAAT
jgi:hypothetical protein